MHALQLDLPLYAPPTLQLAAGLDETFERTVICPLDIIGKTAGGQLVHAQMIVKALTAISFPRAPAVAAIAVFKVPLQLVTIHRHRFLPIRRFYLETPPSFPSTDASPRRL
jgi:hypothetical protein